MMKKLLVTFMPVLFFACEPKAEAEIYTDFTDKVINFSIANKDGIFIELPELYPRPIYFIPDNKDENFILAEKLKTRGFKIEKISSNNMQLSGRRIITATMSDENCRCEIGKVYYSTANVSEYLVAEKIRCVKKN